MMVLAWIGAALLLAVAVRLLLRAIHAQAESQQELRDSLGAFAVPIPGAIVMGAATWGLSPMLLVTPAVVYFSILAVTRGRPLLMLGFMIDRIDRKTSDRYLGILFLLIIIGAFISVEITG